MSYDYEIAARELAAPYDSDDEGIPVKRWNIETSVPRPTRRGTAQHPRTLRKILPTKHKYLNPRTRTEHSYTVVPSYKRNISNRRITHLQVDLHVTEINFGRNGKVTVSAFKDHEGYSPPIIYTYQVNDIRRKPNYKFTIDKETVFSGYLPKNIKEFLDNTPIKDNLIFL